MQQLCPCFTSDDVLSSGTNTVFLLLIWDLQFFQRMHDVEMSTIIIVALIKSKSCSTVVWTLLSTILALHVPVWLSEKLNYMYQHSLLFSKDHVSIHTLLRMTEISWSPLSLWWDSMILLTTLMTATWNNMDTTSSSIRKSEIWTWSTYSMEIIFAIHSCSLQSISNPSPFWSNSPSAASPRAISLHCPLLWISV